MIGANEARRTSSAVFIFLQKQIFLGSVVQRGSRDPANKALWTGGRCRTPILPHAKCRSSLVGTSSSHTRGGHASRSCTRVRETIGKKHSAYTQTRERAHTFSFGCIAVIRFSSSWRKLSCLRDRRGRCREEHRVWLCHRRLSREGQLCCLSVFLQSLAKQFPGDVEGLDPCRRARSKERPRSIPYHTCSQ